MQELGPHQTPAACDSAQLDSVAAGVPACTKSVAAAAAIVERSHPPILGHPVTACVPHKVEILLKQHATQALLPQQAHRYQLILLMADHVVLKRCSALNAATLIPPHDDGEKQAHVSR